MDVRFVKVTGVTPERLALWESWLSPEKRERLARLPEKGRLLSLCGDGLAREMLGEKLGISPELVTFSYTENGKPLTQGAFFSVSHSGDTVACAVSDVPVGVDVEKLRPVPPRMGAALAEYWNTQEEFWQYWTAREAALKCHGGRLWDWKKAEIFDGCITRPDLPGYAVAVYEET